MLMKVKNLMYGAVPACFLFTGSAHAIQIDGAVTFSGVAILNNPVSALATKASILFPTAGLVDGDFSPAISAGDPATFTSPLVFGVTSGLIWSSGGFTFTASAPITATAGPLNTLAIEAVGIVDDGPGGYDATPGELIFGVSPTRRGIGAFGSVTIATSVPLPPPPPAVPEGGTSAVLLAGSLTGLLGLKRRLVK